MPVMYYVVDPKEQLATDEYCDSKWDTEKEATQILLRMSQALREKALVKPLWFSALSLPSEHPNKRKQFFAILIKK